MELKEFNLEQAKAGAPVCTRDGKPVEIVKFNRICNGRYPIIALVTRYKEDPEQIACYYTLRGTFHGNGIPSKMDLMMRSSGRVGYINLFKSEYEDGLYSDGIIYHNEDVAKVNGARQIGHTYIKTVKIDLED